MKRIQALNPFALKVASSTFLRFLILQAILATAIFSLYIHGVATMPFTGSTAPICWVIVGVGVLGLLCLARQRWADAEWIATHVVRVGLMGTVIGLIIAFSATGRGAVDPSQITQMIATVVDGMYISLFATLLGIGVNLWLKINLRLLAPHP